MGGRRTPIVTSARAAGPRGARSAPFHGRAWIRLCGSAARAPWGPRPGQRAVGVSSHGSAGPGQRQSSGPVTALRQARGRGGWHIYDAAPPLDRIDLMDTSASSVRRRPTVPTPNPTATPDRARASGTPAEPHAQPTGAASCAHGAHRRSRRTRLRRHPGQRPCPQRPASARRGWPIPPSPGASTCSWAVSPSRRPTAPCATLAISSMRRPGRSRAR
jgi:hypothetical protein